jgi:phage gp36-like protein
MAHATRADIEAVYGFTLLPGIADYDNDGEVDANVVTAALDHATGVINSHLSVRYKLPLAAVPAFLKAAAIDLAVYRIANTADRLTVEMRQRYEDHVRHLERIADGKAGLGFEDTTPDDDEGTPDATASGRAYSFKSIRA